jgi:hypothetical protein
MGQKNLTSAKPTARTIDFAIAGVQKASTTALALYLGQHPDIFIPTKKEMHAFKRWPSSDNIPDQYIADILRAATPQQMCGDATPIYLYWPRSLEMMLMHNPLMKIIISLRHPVLRAYSGWSMEVKRGREPLGFSAAIREGRERVITANRNVHLVYSYVERGFYSAQIRRLLSIFPREQVFFLRADEVEAQHTSMQELQKFLGVGKHEFKPIQTNVFPSSLVNTDTNIKTDFSYLQNLYTEDIAELGALTGLDITDWQSSPPELTMKTWQVEK